MASTYDNDLRLEEMATGENSGSWGTKTNTNLELVADAFSYGTEIIANADTPITIADGAADAARSLALKITSSEDLTTTRVITLGPNTTSKVWIIENSTSGGQTLTISAGSGSGSNITLANGTTKIIATDGIGAGSNVVELTQDIAIADMSVDGTLSVGGVAIVDNITIDGNTISTTDTNGNLIITPNGTGNVNINSDTLAVSGAEGESAALVLSADEADDNPDIWRIVSNTGNTLGIENQISGSAVSHLTITPNATVANSTFAVAGTVTAPAADIGTISTSVLATLRLKTAGSENAIALNIEENSGTEGWGLGVNANGDLKFYNSGAGTITGLSAVSFTDDNQVLVGAGTARTDFFNTSATASLQVEGTTANTAAASIVRNSNDDNGPQFILGKSNGTSVGSDTVVTDNALLGRISYQGADGSELVEGARIEGSVDGTPTANDMPGRLVFSTTADGAASPTERMRITSSGNVGIASGGDVGLDSTDIALQVGGGSLSNPTIQIRSSSSGTGQLWFGDNSGSDAGRYDGFIQYNQTDRFMYFGTAQTAAMRIDSSQRVLIGADSSQSVFLSSGNQLQIQGLGSNTSAASITRHSNDGGGPYLNFGKSRGTADGAVTSVADSDVLGQIWFVGADGTDIVTPAAGIFAQVDGTPGSNDMPGRLVFSTTADGASSSTERMRIDNAGRVIINNADVSTGTGTNKGLLQVANIDTTYDWSDINTAANGYSSTANEIAVLNTANQDINGWAGIFFQAGESSNGSSINAARIGAIKTSTSGTNTDLAFATRNGSSVMTEHMRINSFGYVGIGTDSPVGALTIIQAGADNDHGIRLQCNDDGASTAPDIQLYKNSASPADGDNIGSIWFRANNSVGDEETYAAIYAVTEDVTNASEDGAISFGTVSGGSFAVRSQIRANGVYVNPEGICLGTASYDTYAAENTLDDYEEGTWTPTLNFGGNATGMVFHTQSGSYVKIGQVVTAQFRIELSSKGSSTGNANFGGIPLTATATSVGTLYPAFFGLHHDVNSGSGNTTANVLPIGQIARGTTNWNYYQADSVTAVTDAYFNNDSVINGTVTFRVT
jgi:hypothetical protein